MAILIDNQQKNHPIEISRIQKTAKVILNALDCPDGELSLVLVDDERMAELNSAYLGRKGPTNVIAFPMREGDFSDLHPDLLGDVVISMDTCAREGREGAIPTEVRFYQLLVHGILHLFGYDHVQSADEAQQMEVKNQELLGLIGLGSPTPDPDTCP
jgi:probable rRNA maturation factor